ncbi:MAG TPA: hypothetical protein VGD23_02090 [Sphingomicrobium sp.]
MYGIALAAAALTVSGAPSPADRFSEAIGAALQADQPRALKALEGVDLTGLPERDQAAARCMIDRFKSAGPSAPREADSLAVRALGYYRSYWHRAMARPDRRQAEERQLESRLRALLNAAPDSRFDELEQLLAERSLREGFYSLQGRTGLLRELMIWSKQEARTMRATLPEGDHEVKVFLLDDFKSLGWSAHATCNRASTGGWATDKALFAVVPKYPSLDHEEFRVTFLGHEAQHFADKLRFKDLQPWELEYRAKLTELAQARTTRARVIGKFLDDQGDNPASPHSYANRKLLSEMTDRLQLASPKSLATAELEVVQATAVALLREDSARRRAAVQAE